MMPLLQTRYSPAGLIQFIPFEVILSDVMEDIDYADHWAFLQSASMALDRLTLSSLLRKFLVASSISREMASMRGLKAFLVTAKYSSRVLRSFTTAFSQASQLPSLAFRASFSSPIPTKMVATAAIGQRGLTAPRSSSMISSKRQTATKPETSWRAARVRGNLRISRSSGGTASASAGLSSSAALKLTATAFICSCSRSRACRTAGLDRSLAGQSSETPCKQAAHRSVRTARQRLPAPQTCWKYCSRRPSLVRSASLPAGVLEMKSRSRERKTSCRVGRTLAILRPSRAGPLLRATSSLRTRCEKKALRSTSMVRGFTSWPSAPTAPRTHAAASEVSSSSRSSSSSSPNSDTLRKQRWCSSNQASRRCSNCRQICPSMLPRSCDLESPSRSPSPTRSSADLNFSGPLDSSRTVISCTQLKSVFWNLTGRSEKPSLALMASKASSLPGKS